MASFAIPLSGLNAAQTELQYISNNLANMNTTGYKDMNVSFADLFASAYAINTNGSGDPIQSGSGVTVSATDSDFSEGNLNNTAVSSNMALSGNGFFVVSGGTDGLQKYTRAGDFTTNEQGQLTTPSGDLLLGYPAQGGVINTSASLQPLEVGTLTSPAQATKDFSITANLDSRANVGDQGPNSTFQIYDSLGQSHTVSVSYTKTGTNTWSYSATIPSTDLAGGATTGTTQVATGTLNFDSTGALVTGGSNSISLNIPGTAQTFADGASNMNLNWNLADSSGNGLVTQTATSSTTSATSQDGYASGTLTSYTVQPDGTIAGSFSSGKTISLGQVAVASFANVQGLQDVGGNSYEGTPASGAAVIGVAGTGGRGNIIGGSIEQSNVNISTEFAKLIAAQQAYSANAKSITTFNQVSQATIAMIQ